MIKVFIFGSSNISGDIIWLSASYARYSWAVSGVWSPHLTQKKSPTMLLVELLQRKVRDFLTCLAESEGFYIKSPVFPIFSRSSSITSISKIHDGSSSFWCTFHLPGTKLRVLSDSSMPVPGFNFNLTWYHVDDIYLVTICEYDTSPIYILIMCMLDFILTMWLWYMGRSNNSHKNFPQNFWRLYCLL